MQFGLNIRAVLNRCTLGIFGMIEKREGYVGLTSYDQKLPFQFFSNLLPKGDPELGCGVPQSTRDRLFSPTKMNFVADRQSRHLRLLGDIPREHSMFESVNLLSRHIAMEAF